MKMSIYTGTGDPTTCHHDEGPRHSCRYVDARNRLMPTAMLEAEKSVVGVEPGPKRNAMVARVFFAAMDRMAAERGISGRRTTSRLEN